MIKIKNIRKIPKVMLKKIEKLDKEYYPKPDGHKRFYKYYTLFNRELCEVIVAVRHYYKRGTANKLWCMVFTQIRSSCVI